MKKIIMLLVGICTCLVACTEQASIEVIDVQNHQFTDWTSLLSVDEVVPLENTSSSLLTVAAKCKIKDGLILFQDFKRKSLFVFDEQDGKFMYEIGKVGYSESEHTDFLLYSPGKDYSISKLSHEGNVEGLRKRKGYQMESERFFSSENHSLVLPDYGCFVMDTYHNGKLCPKYL